MQGRKMGYAPSGNEHEDLYLQCACVMCNHVDFDYGNSVR